MRNIKEGSVKVDNIDIRTFSTEIVDACAIGVESGTTGFKGGDAGHGCRTYVRFTPFCGADVDIREDNDGSIEIIASGDAELRTLLESFKFVAQELEDEIEGRNNF